MSQVTLAVFCSFGELFFRFGLLGLDSPHHGQVGTGPSQVSLLTLSCCGTVLVSRGFEILFVVCLSLSSHLRGPSFKGHSLHS